MPGEGAIQVEGRIVAVLPQALFTVELPNGHRIVAHLRPSQRAAALAKLSVGSVATVEMSPYDFSKGRILLTE